MATPIASNKPAMMDQNDGPQTVQQWRLVRLGMSCQMRTPVKQALQCAQWRARWPRAGRWLFDHVFNVSQLWAASPAAVLVPIPCRAGPDLCRPSESDCSTDPADSQPPHEFHGWLPWAGPAVPAAPEQTDRPASLATLLVQTCHTGDNCGPPPGSVVTPRESTVTPRGSTVTATAVDEPSRPPGGQYRGHRLPTAWGRAGTGTARPSPNETTHVGPQTVAKRAVSPSCPPNRQLPKSLHKRHEFMTRDNGARRCRRKVEVVGGRRRGRGQGRGQGRGRGAGTGTGKYVRECTECPLSWVIYSRYSSSWKTTDNADSIISLEL